MPSDFIIINNNFGSSLFYIYKDTPQWRNPDAYCPGESSRDCATSFENCSYANVDVHNLWPAAGEINGKIYFPRKIIRRILRK